MCAPHGGILNRISEQPDDTSVTSSEPMEADLDAAALADDTQSGGQEGGDRHFVTALARGLEVLACFRSGDSFLSNHEIATRCALPRSTVTRLAYTLTKLGYLHLVPETGQYRLGTATIGLGSAMLVNLDVREVARPLMQSLAHATGGVVALATRDGLSMLYLECCRSDAIVTLSLGTGSRIPLGTSAAGRACLAGSEAGARAELMERLRALDEAAWPKMRRGIETAVSEHALTGCTQSLGDWVREVHGIAMPFNPGRGLPMMTISVAGAAQDFPREHMENTVRAQLVETVRQVERCLGQRGPGE
ncbi:IclR family transcriptional regulator [Paraburkholderia unamae]|nr:IclR family transcriptional regulator [Paraburkholderia unamae]